MSVSFVNIRFLVIISIDAMQGILCNQQLVARSCLFKMLLNITSTTVKFLFQINSFSVLSTICLKRNAFGIMV